MFCGDRPYSSRRASVGLTFEARHAGMKAAARAPAERTIAAAAIVAGSVAVTPNNCDWMSLPRAATQGSARATPESGVERFATSRDFLVDGVSDLSQAAEHR